MAPGGAAATAAPTFSGPALTTTSPGISLSLNGYTLTAAPGGSAGTVKATFSTTPATASSNISITNGTIVLNMAPGGAGATAAPTFSGPALTATSPGISFSLNGHTLNMAPGGTAATAVGTFAGTLTTNVTITSAGATTTITPTGVGTETISTEPTAGDETTIGSATYTWESSCGSASNCISRASSTTTDATRLASAIGGSCGGSGSCSTQTGIAATSSGNVTTITNTTASSVTFTLPVNAAGNNTISPSGSITAAATVACSGSGNAYSGSFIGSATTTTEASHLLSTLQGCPAGVGFSAAADGSTAVEVTYPAPGSFSSLTGAGNVTGVFTWANTAGTDAGPTCTGSGPYTGTFVNNSNVDTLASNFYNALIAGTCAATIGYSVANPNGTATVTLTDLYPGSFSAFSGSGGTGTGAYVSSWSNTAGTDAGPTCTGSGSAYTGTFVNSNVAATLATNFYNALTANSNACANGVYYSVPSPGGATSVTLTDLAPGVTFTGANGTGVVAWTNTQGSTATVGCTGSGTSRAAQFADSTNVNTLASNFYTALTTGTGTCATTIGYSVANPGGSSATVTLTDLYPGSFSAFSGSGGTGTGAYVSSWSNTAGTDAGPTCTGSGSAWTGTFVNSNVAATLATNFYNALTANSNACANGVYYSVPSPGSTSVTLTDLMPGVTFTGANGTGVVTWTNTQGSTATAGCTGSGTSYAAIFVDSTNVDTLASNFYSALTAGTCATTIDYSVANPGGSSATVTLTDTAPGALTFTGSGGTGTGAYVSSWSNTAGQPGSNSCTGSAGAYTVGFINSLTSTTLAGNLQAALALCPAAAGVSSAYPGTNGSSSVTVTNTTPGTTGTSAFSTSGGATGIFTWGSVTGGGNGSYTCTGSGSAATFATSSSTTTLAGNLSSAINSCNGSYSAVGATSSYPGTNGTSSFTVNDTTLGAGTTFSVGGGGTGTFSWGSGATAGSNGTSTCSTTTAGTYAYSSVTTTLASNIAAAINACNTAYPAVGATANYSSGSTFTIYDTTPGSTGTFTFTLGQTNASGIFGWSGQTSGSNGGTSTCTGSAPSFAGTYATSSSTSTLATNFRAAINACAAGTAGITNTSTRSGSSVTITAAAAGTGGNSIDVSPTSGFFYWTAGTLTGGLDGTTSGTTFAYWSVDALATPAQLATNIATAINDNTTLQASTGVNATTNSNVITVTANAAGTGGDSIGTTASLTGFSWAGTTLAGGSGAGTVGAGMYPAKYSFSTTSTPNCGGTATPDYVVYNTGIAGSGSQANVIAYDNIYTGCSGSGTVPSVYWAYNTGTGTAATSTVISWDGTKVAFIETPSSGAATLRILRWVSGQGSDYAHPVAPDHSYANTYAGAGTNTAWSSCPAGSCMISVTFSEAYGDTKSSPWYDYNSDTLYVGDSDGYLHQFTGVFNGTPGESTTASGGTCGTSCKWPVLVSSGNQLTGPVYDFSTGMVFVGDTVSTAPFHSVCATTGINAICSTVGTLTTSGTITSSTTGLGGMTDPPLVDPTQGKAYIFINSDTSTSCETSGGSSTACSDVFQYATKTSVATQTPVKAILGRGMGAGIPLYAGAFNDGYYSAGTGDLYVCGGSASHTSNQQPTLYQIAITSGTMAQSSTTGPTVTSTTGPFCSPVTEVLNGTNDYLFLSVTSLGNDTGCTGACIYSYTIPTTFSSSLAANAGLAAAGGTSGIVIDNTSSTTGASQIYFGTLGSQPCHGDNGTGSPGQGTGGCAVQASQSALQ